MESRSERLCKEALDFYLPFLKRQENVRPSYLMGLEFDRLYPEIKAALEFQGIQHGRSIDHFHTREDDFQKQLLRDRDKVDLAQRQGIKIFTFSNADCDPLTFERRAKDLVNHGRYVAREQRNEALYNRLTYVSFTRQPPARLFEEWQSLVQQGFRSGTVQAKQRRAQQQSRRRYPILGLIGRWGYYGLQALFKPQHSRRRTYH